MKPIRGGADVRAFFSGHQSFPLRYAWPSKAVEALAEYPNLFRLEDAPVRLGVGKNMVAAMAHWCTVTGIVNQVSTNRWRASPLGARVFGREGLDPYFEDIATVWLIQWLLTSRAESPTTWRFVFTQWPRSEFTKRELESALLRVARDLGNSRTNVATIRRDIDVFVRSYLPDSSGKRASVEDTYDSPLAQLGLLAEVDHGIYVLNRGDHGTLPISVFTYALLDFWRRTVPGQMTLSFDRIMHGESSVGGAFHVSDRRLEELLESLPRESGLEFDTSAGMRRVVRRAILDDNEQEELLLSHYRAAGSAR